MKPVKDNEEETLPKRSVYALAFILEFQPISIEDMIIDAKTASSKTMKRVT